MLEKQVGMNQITPIIKSNSTFSPYYFYNDFIKNVSNHYHTNSHSLIEFQLVVESDFQFVGKNYFIDPISLPLILSLCQQLKNYHKSPIPLYLSNNADTVNLLEFLYRSDFFHLAGRNQNPTYPLGKNIFEFNEGYLGGFKGKNIRGEHKVRCYSLNDDQLAEKISVLPGEEAQRDYLVEHYTYKVKEHYFTLLYENENTAHLTNDFIEILAELITNGVLHSKSDTFALMFSDKYKTKFSISDSGIGLYPSLSEKKDSNIYKRFEVLNELSASFTIKVSDHIKQSLLSIFETLYYSMLKDRKGLFDLMCNVVINCGGYFRLHNDTAQVIISSRMINEVKALHEARNSILHNHNLFLFGQIPKELFEKRMAECTNDAKHKVVRLANSIFQKFNEDTRFSSIRLFEVKFRGVHIEVEIPNAETI